MPTETRDVDWEHVAKHGLAKCTPEHTWAEWLADRNAEIERLSRELLEAKEALSCFLGDPRFQVAVGGNPHAVDAMLAKARFVLSPKKEVSRERETG